MHAECDYRFERGACAACHAEPVIYFGGNVTLGYAFLKKPEYVLKHVIGNFLGAFDCLLLTVVFAYSQGFDTT